MQNHRFLMLEKKSGKLVTNDDAFLQQHLLGASFLPFTKEGPQRYLQAYLPCHPPSSLSQELLPGQDADQGFDNSKAVGALGLLPITLTALPHCFPLQPSASPVLFSDSRSAAKHPTTFLHAHIAPTSSTGCWVLSRDPKRYSRISHNMQNKSCLQRILLLELPRYTAGKITSRFLIISLMCASYRGTLLNQYSSKVPCIKVLGLHTKLLRRNKVYIPIIFILNNYGL